MLTLSEQLLLLALNDEKGSVVFAASTALPYGLAGACLLDLLLLNKITFQDKKVELLDTSPTGNGLLDESLQLLSESEKHRDVKFWVNRIHGKVKHLQNRIADGLVEKEILKKEEHKFLWVIPYNRYPTQNMTEEMDIRNMIRNVVLMDQPAGDREIALISLLKACELVNQVFQRGERHNAKKKIKALAAQNEVGKAVSHIVQEITAAVAAAIAVSAAASSAGS